MPPSRAGTNQYHGEGWEFLRNTKLNSVGFFKPVGGGTLPFNQNQFGGALGGKIIKDKMFFFADYEGFRRVFHTVLPATVPTALEKQGNFTGYNVALRNPLTGDPIAGNMDSRLINHSLCFDRAFAAAQIPIFQAIPTTIRRLPPTPPITTKVISATIISLIRSSHFLHAIARAETPISS